MPQHSYIARRRLTTLTWRHLNDVSQSASWLTVYNIIITAPTRHSLSTRLPLHSTNSRLPVLVLQTRRLRACVRVCY